MLEIQKKKTLLLLYGARLRIYLNRKCPGFLFDFYSKTEDATRKIEWKMCKHVGYARARETVKPVKRTENARGLQGPFIIFNTI